MKTTTHLPALAVLAALALAGTAAGAADPLVDVTAAARAAPGFAGFSAERGAQFFRRPHGDWSCATCHTENPRQAGRHAVTGKAIEPMAPAFNPGRLTDPAKVEKWFRRNCKDVLSRECTAQEKGDVMVYLRSIGR